MIARVRTTLIFGGFFGSATVPVASVGVPPAEYER
jgi:hypothetical protein